MTGSRNAGGVPIRALAVAMTWRKNSVLAASAVPRVAPADPWIMGLSTSKAGLILPVCKFAGAL
jgi:hypothetical protein